jgi:hypothetical protein
MLMTYRSVWVDWVDPQLGGETGRSEDIPLRRSSSQKLQSIVDSLLLQIPPATTPNAVMPYYWRHIPRPPP